MARYVDEFVSHDFLSEDPTVLVSNFASDDEVGIDKARALVRVVGVGIIRQKLLGTLKSLYHVITTYLIRGSTGPRA